MCCYYCTYCVYINWKKKFAHCIWELISVYKQWRDSTEIEEEISLEV